jgi:8-oxo-dGTP diphosphatase
MSPLPLKASAGILINDRKEILLAQRPPHKYMAGWWEFPGGKLEPSETAEQALKRELAEEIGVTVKSLIPLRKVIFPYPDFVLDLEVFVCLSWEGTAMPQEGQEIKWISINDFENYPVLKANTEILEDLKKFIKKL